MKKYSVYLLALTLIIFLKFFLFQKNMPVNAEWSSDSSINTPIANESYAEIASSILPDGNGGSYISWQSAGNSSSFWIQRINEEGNKLWGESGKFIGKTTSSARPAILILDTNNELYVVWESSTESGLRIYGQKLNSNGDLLWGESGIQISNDSLVASADPDAAVDIYNNLIVTWGNFGGNMSIFAQKLNEEGNVLWTPTGVNVSGSGGDRRYPKLVVYGDETVIVWRQLISQGRFELITQKLSSDGVKQWNTNGIRISDYIGSNDSGYEIIKYPDGRFLVTWISTNPDSRGTYANVVDLNGVFQWEDDRLLGGMKSLLISGEHLFYISTSADGNKRNFNLHITDLETNRITSTDGIPLTNTDTLKFDSQMITDGYGGIIFLWYDEGLEDSPNFRLEDDLFAQRIDSGGNLLWNSGLLLTTAQGEQFGGLVSSADENSYVAAWTDSRNGNNDVYAQRINFDGTLEGGVDPTPTPTLEPCVLTHFGDPITQINPDWADAPYGGKTENGERIDFNGHLWRSAGVSDDISYWGCTLTSHAMILNYYARLQNVKREGTEELFQTNPYELNEWMVNNNGYATGATKYDDQGNKFVESSLVDPGGVEDFATAHSISLAYDAFVEKPASQTAIEFTEAQSDHINAKMCDLIPAILKVDQPGDWGWHYVVASGKAAGDLGDTWRLHDPLYENTTSLADRYSNAHYQILGASTMAPSNYVSFYMHSPAEMIITDPEGRKLGYDPISDTLFSEIPEGSYYVDELSPFQGDGVMTAQVATIKNPLVGEYDLQTIGTGTGAYTIETFKRFEERKRLSEINSNTQSNLVENYTIFLSDSVEDDGNITKKINIAIDPFNNHGVIIYPWTQFRIIPVEIYSTPSFDATMLNTDMITFGPAHASVYRDVAHTRDLNGDGLKDLELFFSIKDTGITKDTAEACVEAQDESGIALKGCSELQILTLLEFLKHLKNR